MTGILKHPFIHEHLYRIMAAELTSNDLTNPDLVLAPVINNAMSLKRDFFKLVSSTVNIEDIASLDLLKSKPWWWLMPTILPPYQNHHELGMLYTVYRQMTTGNMTFLVGEEIGRALYNTDYEVRTGDLKFPSDTFIIYFQNSKAPVGPSFLTWISVDRVNVNHESMQIRIIYGFIDEDGDEANSDFLLFEGPDDLILRNDEFVANLNNQDISSLSLKPITDTHRQNVISVFTSLINFLLYLDAVNDFMIIKPCIQNTESVKNPKKIRRREKLQLKQSLYSYTYVGQNYESRIHKNNTGSPFDYRIIVRGHWRHQWIGPKTDTFGQSTLGTTQKMKWIEPYWKGPESGPTHTSIKIMR